MIQQHTQAIGEKLWAPVSAQAIGEKLWAPISARGERGEVKNATPRMPQTARGDRPMTIGQFGSFLPRPSNHAAAGGPASSPRAQHRETKDIPVTCGGVVYECDGYEVFYGLGGEPDKAAKTKTKEKRDGYDKFYGIRARDRQPFAASATPVGQESSALSTADAVVDTIEGAANQQRDSDQEEKSRAPQQPCGVTRMMSMPGRIGIKTLPPGTVRVGQPRPDATASAKLGSVAESYCVATPAHPGPPLDMKPVSLDVEQYNVSTPSAPLRVPRLNV